LPSLAVRINISGVAICAWVAGSCQRTDGAFPLKRSLTKRSHALAIRGDVRRERSGK